MKLLTSSSTQHKHKNNGRYEVMVFLILGMWLFVTARRQTLFPERLKAARRRKKSAEKKTNCAVSPPFYLLVNYFLHLGTSHSFYQWKIKKEPFPGSQVKPDHTVETRHNILSPYRLLNHTMVSVCDSDPKYHENKTKKTKKDTVHWILSVVSYIGPGKD